MENQTQEARERSLDVAPLPDDLTAEQQKLELWSALQEHNHMHRCKHEKQATVKGRRAAIEREWPSYDSVVNDMTKADYSHTLRCPHDMRSLSAGGRGGGATDGGKTLCPHGVVCQAKLELFTQPEDSAGAAYTGLLTPGQTVEHCIVRLSSVMRPPTDVVKTPVGKAILRVTGNKLRKAKLFPTAAIKVFRGNGIRSGNLLFSGCKVGQPETDYFAHVQCTQLSERLSRALKPFVKKFWTYSDYPLSLGLSDFCSFDVDGAVPDVANGIHFPYVLILNPVRRMGARGGHVSNAPSKQDEAKKCPHSHGRGANAGKGKAKLEPFDSFLDNMESIPTGTVLFDLFACPDPASVPDPSRLQRIGRLVTTSAAIPSRPDDGLFFRHQKKEEDFALRPAWKDAVNTKCSPDEGATVGTVAKLAGWELFEGQIAKNKFVDFER